MSRKLLVTFNNTLEIEEMFGDETYCCNIENDVYVNDPTSYINTFPHLLDRIFDGELGEDYKVISCRNNEKETVYKIEYDGELDFNSDETSDYIYDRLEQYIIELEGLDENKCYIINNDFGIYDIEEI